MGWKLRTIDNDTFSNLVKMSTSFRQLGLQLGMTGGSTQDSLKKRVTKLQLDTSHFTGKGWARGRTKYNHPTLARLGELTRKRLFGKPGRPHTIESRQKMSRSASERSFENNARVKSYDVTHWETDQTIRVRGTWEKRYAEWLNAQKIRWERPKTTFKWKRESDDIEHTYHPDFYLPDTNTYVEIKGYMWKDETRNIDDETKLKMVIAQNDFKLLVLMRRELKEMGVL